MMASTVTNGPVSGWYWKRRTLPHITAPAANRPAEGKKAHSPRFTTPFNTVPDSNAYAIQVGKPNCAVHTPNMNASKKKLRNSARLGFGAARALRYAKCG